MTSQPNASVRFRRAIERRALWLAEDAAREMGSLSLEDALHLVQLYGERGSPKFEKAATRWLRRYLNEESPTLERFAKAVADLTKLVGDRGPIGERIGALPGIREWASIEEDEWDGGDE